jgi:methylmalonyl-CoA mutase
MDLDPYNWEVFDLGRKVNKYKDPYLPFKVRDKVIEIKTHSESLSHSQIPKIALLNTRLGEIY